MREQSKRGECIVVIRNHTEADRGYLFNNAKEILSKNPIYLHAVVLYPLSGNSGFSEKALLYEFEENAQRFFSKYARHIGLWSWVDKYTIEIDNPNRSWMVKLVEEALGNSEMQIFGMAVLGKQDLSAVYLGNDQIDTYVLELIRSLIGDNQNLLGKYAKIEKVSSKFTGKIWKLARE